MRTQYAQEQCERFNGDSTYPVQGMDFWALVDIKEKLYTEKRLTADEMRDMAQRIGRIIEDAETYGSIEV